MTSLVLYKEQLDDAIVEYEVLAPSDSSLCTDELAAIEAKIAENQALISSINKDIERWTDHSDKVDKIVAVSSGVLAGLIDSFFVGEFSLLEGINWGQESIEKLIINVAEKTGCKGKDLSSTVSKLEEAFPIPADAATNIFGGGKQHHLRDFSHHPTPLGLFFSLLTQFTGKVFGTNTVGAFIIADLPDKSLIGVDLPRKLAIGVKDWLFHMVSDMAGASGTLYKGNSGTGLPGPIVSLLKELSTLPIFKQKNKAGNKEFSVWVSKLFNGTLLAEKDSSGRIIKGSELKFDLRAEIGVLHELGRQAIPIIINEAVVRIFYFIRQLIKELKSVEINSIKDFIHKPNWRVILPYNNRTITRMLTISTGTFVAVDIADASIRSVIKTGPTPAFFAEMVLRVNFVGIGRFALSLVSEGRMEYKKERARDERIEIMSEQIRLGNARVFLRAGEMWEEAYNAEVVVDGLISQCNDYSKMVYDNYKAIVSSGQAISSTIPGIERNNPELIDDITEITKY